MSTFMITVDMLSLAMEGRKVDRYDWLRRNIGDISGKPCEAAVLVLYYYGKQTRGFLDEESWRQTQGECENMWAWSPKPVISSNNQQYTVWDKIMPKIIRY